MGPAEGFDLATNETVIIACYGDCATKKFVRGQREEVTGK